MVATRGLVQTHDESNRLRRPGRVALTLNSHIESNMILGVASAERLTTDKDFGDPVRLAGAVHDGKRPKTVVQKLKIDV